MNRFIIGLGSNIDPGENIERAKDLLKNKLKILSESSLALTPAIDRPEQNDYLNCTVLVESNLNKNEINTSLKNIEIVLKRKKLKDKYAPRTIDLDIIVWNGEIIDKDFYKRDFLNKSVLELMPGLKY